jgi:hypothetical protein
VVETGARGTAENAWNHEAFCNGATAHAASARAVLPQRQPLTARRLREHHRITRPVRSLRHPHASDVGFETSEACRKDMT